MAGGRGGFFWNSEGNSWERLLNCHVTGRLEEDVESHFRYVEGAGCGQMVFAGVAALPLREGTMTMRRRNTWKRLSIRHFHGRTHTIDPRKEGRPLQEILSNWGTRWLGRWIGKVSVLKTVIITTTTTLSLISSTTSCNLYFSNRKEFFSWRFPVPFLSLVDHKYKYYKKERSRSIQLGGKKMGSRYPSGLPWGFVTSCRKRSYLVTRLSVSCNHSN